MERKTADMQVIFSKLTEQNKQMLVLIAKSIKMTQGTEHQNYKLAMKGRN